MFDMGYLKKCIQGWFWNFVFGKGCHLWGTWTLYYIKDGKKVVRSFSKWSLQHCRQSTCKAKVGLLSVRSMRFLLHLIRIHVWGLAKLQKIQEHLGRLFKRHRASYNYVTRAGILIPRDLTDYQLMNHVCTADKIFVFYNFTMAIAVTPYKLATVR